MTGASGSKSNLLPPLQHNGHADVVPRYVHVKLRGGLHCLHGDWAHGGLVNKPWKCILDPEVLEPGGFLLSEVCRVNDHTPTRLYVGVKVHRVDPWFRPLPLGEVGLAHSLLVVFGVDD
eukprot:CAMPEP_0172019128 /NCGR_PEP_ID=MMETSP1041-20130122/12473_1 /TAXON_ID=464988 /ORGANISM="Hemiselmis andersenii, Strain CCMP439" /LENGTH=118 /DNA_ID=CAMNT_0012674285 /DNA_START=34 /DNA_END=390 /DNA_ORIENTATION=+